MSDYECVRCRDRGKQWEGDDPKCAFVNGGYFSSENWNCATMNKLRDLAIDNAVYCDDQYAAVLPVREDAAHIVLSWYKRRGRTEGAWFVDGERIAPLSLATADIVIREHERNL